MFKIAMPIKRKNLVIFAVIMQMFLLTSGMSTGYAAPNASDNKNQPRLLAALEKPYSAPALQGISAWFNSSPLQLAQLKGKVVLLNFWNYSCDNCLHMLPYLAAWNANYRDKGLVIIGVLTPEFSFEKESARIKQALTRLAITYPVALDANEATWKNYRNHYRPAQYLIDKNGNVVYQHFNEGGSVATERNIQALLGLQGMGLSQVPKETPEYSLFQTPKMYLGSSRAQHFSSQELIRQNIAFHYSYPEIVSQDDWALKGRWIVSAENIRPAENNAAMKLHFNAKKVYVVMGSTGKQAAAVKILLNGAPISADAGKDVNGSTIMVSEHRLYEIINFEAAQRGAIELIPTSTGVEFYSFMFDG